MNLSLVFKLAAGFMVLWVLQMWFLPAMVEETFGWNSSPDLRVLMRYMGMAMAALATLHWTLPMWAGEKLSNFGMVSAFFRHYLVLWGCMTSLWKYHHLPLRTSSARP